MESIPTRPSSKLLQWREIAIDISQREYKMMKKISGLALGLHPVIKHKNQLGLDNASPIYGPSLGFV